MALQHGYKKEEWCITQSKCVPVSFKWSIQNLSHHLREVGYFVQSSTFPSNSEDNIEWYMKAYPRGSNVENKNNLSIFLYAAYEGVNNTTAKYRCSLLHCSDKKPTYSLKTDMQPVEEFKPGFGWPKFISTATLQDKSKELLSDDTLTIHVELEVVTASVNTAGKSRILNIPDCRMGDDFAELLNKELFSDVTLMANGEKFRVHKNVLCARSPVFFAMFTSEMQEKNQDVIEIADLDNDALRDLLHFVYSGNAPVDASVQRTVGLLEAADKYAVERLKMMCEQDLCQQITVNNAPDLLSLAYLHNANELKAAAMEFIYSPNNFSAVVKSETWSSVLSLPNFLTEMLEYRMQRDLKNKT